ncbi:Mitochodrial transcription termination factor [Parasponia andersonii]|uniref:Mitochodrial transcription termination factor n=1 Tax=Parasponia andersonii TaxID=3476 RepID=A0A2P5E450_PARAD|nr:Mitochodrial transcription termination factor [Parasponia andersonii]
MYRTAIASLNPRFKVLLQLLPTSSPKLEIFAMAERIGSQKFVSSFYTSAISKPISYFLCKSNVLGNYSARALGPISNNLGFMRNPNPLPLRFMSTSSNQQSFAVSYLINSLGFSPQTAVSASKYLNFETPGKPDKAIEFFKDYGFTQTQISRVFKKCPGLLLSDREKTILPKLEFFESKGLSGPELAKVVSGFPYILRNSLAKQIVPSYEFFSNLFQSEEKAILTVKRCPDIICRNVEKYVAPNITTLREHGVPASNIATLLHYQPKAFMISMDRFREIVEEVERMGFNASKMKFLLAVFAFRAMSKQTWESKVDAFKKWGWSDEEISIAFERNPWCMMASEDKIMACMDFFTNKMGWSPCRVANRPVLLTLSLKKRVMPRCSLFQVLLSKGLVEKEVSLAALLETSEEKFLKKFVKCYKEEAPELLKLYKEKMDLSKG